MRLRPRTKPAITTKCTQMPPLIMAMPTRLDLSIQLCTGINIATVAQIHLTPQIFFGTPMFMPTRLNLPIQIPAGIKITTVAQLHLPTKISQDIPMVMSTRLKVLIQIPTGINTTTPTQFNLPVQIPKRINIAITNQKKFPPTKYLMISLPSKKQTRFTR